MNVRLEFEQAFGRGVFLRPLFYRYPGGIRFELSEGDSAVEQFLTALEKARTICDSVFIEAESLTVVLCVPAWGGKFAYRDTLQQLRRAGIRIPKDRSLWLDNEYAAIDEEDNPWIRIAFRASTRLLPNVLWCALAQDLGIEPAPAGSIYLADIRNRILVFPYDDRGMDVVGPNHVRLASLYKEFRRFALEHDKAQMDATFNAT